MKTIIVGGGCSGVVAAIRAKNNKDEVIILEKNDTLLKKLLLTGNGRCNYFNEIYSNIFYHSENIDLVDDIISSDNVDMAKDFFDKLGIIPKIKNGCYYPYANQAANIRDVLIKELERLGILIKYNTNVVDISKKKKKFKITCDDTIYDCDRVILSTGGMSYKKTGSDGFGYELLGRLGHTIVKPVPGLVQLKSNNKYRNSWDGVRCSVRVELFENDKYVSFEEGEIQFTKNGVSGICIFNLSHFVSRGLLNDNKYIIKINFVPFVDTLLSIWMDKYSKKNPHKNISELLVGFLNKKMIPIILGTSGINGGTKYDELSNDDKIKLFRNLRSFRVDITGTMGFDNAQVSNGGVKLDEVILKTMESRVVSGLYITGELLDITGNCGGYNLTECWISGLLAGSSVGDAND